MRGAGSARGRHRTSTRDRVLDAALELFGARGFAATTTKDISKRAGVNEVTVFRLFKSKQEVFVSVLAERSVLPRIIESVEFDREAPIEDVMVESVRSVLEALKENKHILRVTLSDAWRHPKARKMLGEGPLRKGTDFLAEKLTAEMNAHRIKTTDPEVAAKALMGMVQAYFVTTYMLQNEKESPERDERHVKGFVSIFLNGVGAPEEGGSR